MNALSRKYFLTNCLMVFAVSIYLLTPVHQTNASTATTYGGSFTVGMGYEPTSLDPAVTADNASLLVSNQIYDTLVRYVPGGSIILPGLADSWSVSHDGLTWTFNLHPGIIFHDETPLDASAVLFNFSRWWDTTNEYHVGNFENFAYFFNGFNGDPGCLITGMSVIGSHQFILQLLYPNHSLLSILANPAFGIASPTAVRAGKSSTNPVGSGPFRFVEWTAGDHIHLTANTSYWGGKPGLTDLTFKIISENVTRLAAIQNDTIQAALDLPDENASVVQLDSSMRAISRPSWTIGYLGMNQAKAPLNDIRVREAIAHAINLPKLITDHYGPGYQPADQFLPPTIWGYNPSAPDYTYDPELAKSLLAETGYKNEPITLSFRDVIRPYLPNPAAVAAAIQADLSAAGFNIIIESMESSIFLDEYQKGNLEIFLLGWGADFLHPDNFFAWHFCSNNLSFGPQDTFLCDLISQARLEPEYTNQLNLYLSASMRIMQILPVLPLAYYNPLVVIRSNVAGLHPSPFMMQDWYGDVFYAASWLYLPAIRR